MQFSEILSLIQNVNNQPKVLLFSIFFNLLLDCQKKVFQIYFLFSHFYLKMSRRKNQFDFIYFIMYLICYEKN